MPDVPMPLRQSWLKLPEENAQQYEAFERYRDMGISRSVELVIEQLAPVNALLEGEEERRIMLRNLARTGRLEVGTPFAYQIMTWAARYRWAFRAEQFDRHVAAMAADKVAAEHAQMLQRHLAISMQLQEKALSRLRDMDPSELTSKEVLAFLKDAIILERTSREMPRSLAIRSEDTAPADPEAHDRRMLSDVFTILVESGALPEGSDFDLAEGIIDAKAHEVYSTPADDEADRVPADSAP